MILTLLLALAQAPPHNVMPKDYFSLATVTELSVSPNGKQVAYCEARWDEKANDRKADLWVVATDGKSKPRRLTSDRGNDSHPCWSADGMSIFVLASRGEKSKPQVWRVPVADGELYAVTKIKDGVSSFDYAPQRDSLFISVDTTTTDDDAFSKLRNKFKLNYSKGDRVTSKLIEIDLECLGEREVFDAKRYIREFAVTRDGERFAMITAKDDSVIQSEGGSRLDILDRFTEEVVSSDQSWRKDAASPYPWLGSIAWNPSGTRVAYCSIFDAYPAEIIINEKTDDGWKATRVQRRKDVQVHGYGSPLRWRDDRTLGYLGDKNGHVGVYGYAAKTEDILGVTRPDTVVYGFDFGPVASSIAVTLEASSSEFPEIFVRGKDAKQLTHLNPQTKNWKLPTIQHITWKAKDGTTVGGVLELPPGHAKSKGKIPLVVAMHGGPTTSSDAAMLFDPHNGRLYLSAAGYAVLAPNYRGSTGYGDKFVTDLVGHENDIEVKDILAGMQKLVDDGIVDPERIAVMGWSNGGYLTNCLITLKDPPFQFKAASSGAGILDTAAEWGFNDEPAYPTVFKEGFPLASA